MGFEIRLYQHRLSSQLCCSFNIIRELLTAVVVAAAKQPVAWDTSNSGTWGRSDDTLGEACG